ncbi:MAG: methionyl-tRNA formyltransferase [Cellvibrionaceae bacterium]|nr:methionyl-tRNA formyltransferase [Cellvibrionaceae bacterium]
MATDAGLKIIFAGTPEFAARHLQALLQSCHQVVAVYTQPDRPAGRGKKLQASPVKEMAIAAGIDVQQPVSLKTPEAQATLAAYGADVMVVVAYGLLLPAAILSLPRFGCINVHASLLPRWRGAAPIQRAIEAGDRETGVTIMQMDVGLDTGPMLSIRTCPILPGDSAADLHDRLAEIGPPALLDTLHQLLNGPLQGEIQDNHLATYAHKLTKEEAAIDWSQPAELIERRIRAFNPFPVAFTVFGDENLRVYEAQLHSRTHSAEPGTILQAERELVVACGGQTSLALLTVQLPGKKGNDGERFA